MFVVSGTREHSSLRAMIAFFQIHLFIPQVHFTQIAVLQGKHAKGFLRSRFHAGHPICLALCELLILCHSVVDFRLDIYVSK